MDDDSQDSGCMAMLAMTASFLLCFIIYRVKMRHCEAILRETSRTLDDVRRTAEALQTKRRVVKAATMTAEKTLKEYSALLSMLHKLREKEFSEPDLPALRHQLEVETTRAQVNMVQNCVLAMSEEVLNLGSHHASTKGGALTTSLYNHGRSLMNMSEEILSFLDKRSTDHIK